MKAQPVTRTVSRRPRASAAKPSKIRVGLVGLGRRGAQFLDLLLAMPDVEVPALCTASATNRDAAVGRIRKARDTEPETYRRREDYARLVAREDLDAVLVTTAWDSHAEIAVAAMKAGKYVAVEVPVALTLEECWRLVDTHEQTRVPCMMLENWSFRRDNLAVLNMIRAGLLGDIIHCHCAHSHNCIPIWFFDSQGRPRWAADYLRKYNADQYPTHSVGPVLSWMNINCGDRFAYLTSTATRQVGINDQLRTLFGANHPAARRRYVQGDIVTTVVKTARGNTLVINYDMQLPRPYDNRWLIQGSRGVYSEAHNAVYLHGRSPRSEEWEPFEPYQKRHDHPWWKRLDPQVARLGHGGTDYLELRLFLDAVRDRTSPPIDLYDSVAMSCLIPLSGQSIAQGSAPVECPDFTRGRWKRRRPSFAVVG